MKICFLNNNSMLLDNALVDFGELQELDQRIKQLQMGPNPYTWFTMDTLRDASFFDRFKKRSKTAKLIYNRKRNAKTIKMCWDNSSLKQIPISTNGWRTHINITQIITIQKEINVFFLNFIYKIYTLVK